MPSEDCDSAKEVGRKKVDNKRTDLEAGIKSVIETSVVIFFLFFFLSQSLLEQRVNFSTFHYYLNRSKGGETMANPFSTVRTASIGRSTSDQ